MSVLGGAEWESTWLMFFEQAASGQIKGGADKDRPSGKQACSPTPEVVRGRSSWLRKTANIHNKIPAF